MFWCKECKRKLAQMQNELECTFKCITKSPGKIFGSCERPCKFQTSHLQNYSILTKSLCIAEPSTCRPDFFQCATGNFMCISVDWKCDGNPECDDKSDEMNCCEYTINFFTNCNRVLFLLKLVWIIIIIENILSRFCSRKYSTRCDAWPVSVDKQWLVVEP